MAEKHLRLAINWMGEKLGVLETRRHYASYFRGIPDFKQYRTKMVTMDHSCEIFNLFRVLEDKFVVFDATEDECGYYCDYD